jgi:hypothetical protein
LKLDQHISDLLYRYDCVVVPDFGGFVANYQAARINSRTHSFSPPGKKISFNSHLKSNDGLLANHIVQEFGLSYEDALLSISDCVLEYQRELNKGKRILIENVGVLYQDSYNNVLFEPITNVNYLSDSFGLEKFHVSPALAETEETKVVTIKKTERRRIHPARIAAAIAMPIFLIGSAMMFQSKQDGNYGQIQLSNLGFNKVEARYEIRNEVINLDEDYTDEIDFEALIKQAENRSFLKLEEEATIENWYVVGGCFSEASNAKSFIKKLQKKGYPAKQIDQYKKLHAVAYQGFEKESDARAFLARLKQDNASGWLLKRK